MTVRLDVMRRSCGRAARRGTATPAHAGSNPAMIFVAVAQTDRAPGCEPGSCECKSHRSPLDQARAGAFTLRSTASRGATKRYPSSTASTIAKATGLVMSVLLGYRL